MDKREIAKGYRGVWYDARIDKFAAEIYVAGKKKYLGSYREAHEAGEAYAAAARDRPLVRKGPSFAEAVAEIADRPVVGDVVTYEGQTFEFIGTQFRKVAGRTLPFFEWRSACTTCGEEYETLSSAGGGRGVTRRCLAHRKGPAAPTVLDLRGSIAAFEVLYGAVPLKFSEAGLLLAFLQDQHPGVWPGDRETWAAFKVWQL